MKEKLFYQFKKKIIQVKKNLKNSFINFFKKNNEINIDFFNEVEEQLLSLDIGISTTKLIIDQIKKQINTQNFNEIDKIYSIIKRTMQDILNLSKKNCYISKKVDSLKIILFFGVNGVGKTISVFKLANTYMKKGKKTAVVCADTFRAASIEQTKILSDQYNIPIFFSKNKKDAASVVFDSIKFLKKEKSIQFIIIDTAGRLENKINLIEELRKITRVIKKLYDQPYFEKILVLDSTIGQNSIHQAKIFYNSVQPTGIFLTKLDGTARGGIIFPIINFFKIPIKYIGFGESINDIKEFNQEHFINSLFKRH
ncbi:signal recognition particle-docking protein FtsY [Candidatus Riesia pediculicola]|uniref:Signal recognition particle-docking protein FtsY n=1 Tax=Riesia pediculicola (strain USDA) TaxID=515618 RepID=D4G7I5_RIEPU|nr:signal recognition particle-docking protein FtsY [Candidatus Riesia pediculicola]ADD79694.1 signal recognition particle-docking protein FtsY [Candidatus Riesia pediculicola USDA]ARC53566.1 hypothetical protein AOE55_00105 [Candidatus Riesia pediculicola]QOJ86221.1 signal recognition particle-docking protein FtsY [Candidatus Riesia pediculicola]